MQINELIVLQIKVTIIFHIFITFLRISVIIKGVKITSSLIFKSGY